MAKTAARDRAGRFSIGGQLAGHPVVGIADAAIEFGVEIGDEIDGDRLRLAPACRAW